MWTTGQPLELIFSQPMRSDGALFLHCVRLSKSFFVMVFESSYLACFQMNTSNFHFVDVHAIFSHAPSLNLSFIPLRYIVAGNLLLLLSHEICTTFSFSQFHQTCPIFKFGHDPHSYNLHPHI